MPLLKLALKAGVDREATALSNEGRWFETDKVRFYGGFPQKIGGWVKDTGTQMSGLLPSTGSYWGVARSLWNWATLAGNNLLGLGTHLKYYIQQSVNGIFYDVTPLRRSATIAANAFTTTNTSTTVTVNDTGHGASTGDFVTISGVGGAVNGIPAAALNKEFVLTRTGANTYTITVSAPATSSGTTGACDVAYQISVGLEIAGTASGWGAGGWGGTTTGSASTGWGVAAAVGVAVQLRLWSQGNYGQNLIINPRGGALYLWAVGATPSTFDRAGLLSSSSSGIYTTDADCPSVCNSVMISDASRFVIAFGVNDYSSATQDPMLIRWSAQNDYTKWTPASSNQAGSYRLSVGSAIIANEQTRQEILVWTDAALYSMQYTDYPFFWGFSLLGANISIAGPNAKTTAANTTFWMGRDKFYRYAGRIEAMYCPLHTHIFQNINLDQAFQFFGCTNESFNEVWFFYCSAASTSIDSYVLYNYVDDTWAYGSLARTAWVESKLRQNPVAAGYNGLVIYHESGTDDGTTNPPTPITAYAQSGDMDIADGQSYGFVWRMLPDISFDGSTVNVPSVTFTLKPRRNPGAPYYPESSPTVASTQNYQHQRTYNVQEFTQIIYTRVRGRQMAFRVESDGLGVQWQLGVPRIDVRPDGRR